MIRKILASSCVILVAGSSALAQTNAETNAGIQFNFSTPGAHSLAVGGAFLAVADDATAAYTNPAGLTLIPEPEISIEARQWTYTHMFTNRGRLEGPPTGIGVDTVEGIEEGEARNTVLGNSFFSYVYPQKRWALAIYRHELANFEANNETQGAFLDRPLKRLHPTRTAMSLTVVNHGVSAAYTIGKKQRFRAGLGLSYYTFTLASETIRYALGRGAEGFYMPPDYAADNQRSSQVQVGDDTAWGFSAGFIWKLSGVSRVGGVYRRGPRSDFRAKFNSKPRAPAAFTETDQRASFKVPDIYGLGLTIQPSSSTTISLDYNRVEYSDMTSGLVDIFALNSSGDPELEHFKVDDADELRIGFEYAFSMHGILVFTRLGAWYDPDHRIRFEGERRASQALFQPGKNEVHYSAGFGIGLKRVQINFAFDHSEDLRTAALSIAVRF